MRIVLAVMSLAGVAGCFREGSQPASVTNSTDRALLAEDATCRRGDDLEAGVEDQRPDGRLRTHNVGVLSGPTGRTWTGMEIPEFVPTKHGTLELFLLDRADGGLLAFYREPYDLGSCTLGGTTNCAYLAELYKDGVRAWSLPLNPLMSRPDGLEIQDIRLANGVLLFNEACQGYAAEQQNRCSSLVAVDPAANRVAWRTPALVSNGRFAVRGCYILAGYGFTSEPDNVFLVERSTGKIAQKLPVSSAPQGWTLLNDSRADVTLYSGLKRRYKLDGIETHSGRIRELDAPEVMYGGASYGGATYGGATYGGDVPRRHPRGHSRMP